MLTWEEVGPETKLEPVLERWPEVAPTLVALSAHFRALEDPLLRRTFARAATLRQVGEAAGVELPRLLRALGEVVARGASPADAAAATRAGEGIAPASAPPDWARQAVPAARRDARDDVGRGVHPLPEVMKDLEALPAGAVMELITPLVPAPLLGLLARKGHEAYARFEPQLGAARTLIRRGG